MGFFHRSRDLISGESISQTGGSEAIHGTDFTSATGKVAGVEQTAVSVRATGDSLDGTGTVEFVLAATVDGDDWDDTTQDQNDFLRITLQLNGGNTVQKTTPVDMSGVYAVRLDRIANSDSEALSNVSAKLGAQQ